MTFFSKVKTRDKRGGCPYFFSAIKKIPKPAHAPDQKRLRDFLVIRWLAGYVNDRLISIIGFPVFRFISYLLVKSV